MKTRVFPTAGPPRSRGRRSTLSAVVLLCVAWTGTVCGQLPIAPPTDRPAAGGGAPRLQFNDAPLHMVLEAYSEATGRTLLTAPGLPAVKITVEGQSELTNAEYLQAIETVLNMHGIAIVKVDQKFAKIVPNKSFLQEAEGFIPQVRGDPLPNTGELVSQMVLLKNIEIGEAMSAVKPLQHAGYGSATPFERINGILVTDTAANVNRIIRIVDFIDQPPELREEMKIIDVKYAKPSEIKKKLEEIIAESQEDKKKKSTVPVSRLKGQPGVTTRSRTIPGLIRPPRKGSSTPVTTEELIESAERGLIRGKVHIVADDRTKVLIIITRPENFQFFERIIQVLDKGTDPDVTVQVVRLEYADAETVASTLNTLIGKEKGKDEVAATKKGGEPAQEGKSAGLREYVQRLRTEAPEAEGVSKLGELSAANIKILPDKRTNSLLIMASKADFAAIEGIVEIMDMQLSQVLIEAVIIQVELGNQFESGVHWVQNAVMLHEGVRSGAQESMAAVAASGGAGGTPVNAATLTTPGSWSSAAGLSLYFTHFGLSLDAIVKMVSTDSRTQILSAPVIVTTDNTEATLSSSEQRYFLKGSTIDQFGNVRPQTEIKDIGLNLKVTPHINQQKNVMMEIEQDISDLGPEQAIEGQGTWPTTTKRSFNASIAVRDRETIVLGGLVRNLKTQSKTKVPILGDIPLIGLLFRSESSDKTRGEVVAFITPYVMDTPEEIAAESARRKRALNVGGLWERGWSDSALSEEPGREKKRKEREEAEPEPLQLPPGPAPARAADRSAADPDRMGLDFIDAVERQSGAAR